MSIGVEAPVDEITATICSYAVDTGYADLTPSALESAKLFTLECIGHMLHSQPQPVSRLVVDVVRSLACAPEAIVVGTDLRTSVAEAAYANGALAHADELEACGTLPGTGLIPPISAGLAVGELRRATGRDYLAALVVGIEIQGRLGTAAIGACDRGFMGFSFVGPAGAGVTAGKLFGLDADQMRSCLGGALPLGGGSLRGDGYMSHVHEAGVPARTGVWAALLASRGFTANPEYLDGRFSWGEQYVGQSSTRPYNPDAITAGLGGSLFLDTSDVATKLYGTSGVTHQAVEGMIRLMTVHGLEPSDIESVDLLVPPFALRIASFHEPANGEQSKFSLEQAVAGILVHGVPRLPYVHAFTDQAAVDPRYVEARGRVRVVVDESRPNVRGFDEQTVTLRLRDGRQLSLAVDRLDVAGRTGNPLTVEARLDVFRATAERLGGDRTERLIDVVMGFENHTVPDVAALVGAPRDR
jgi:2-methylcitrate dehydratase PrpD